MQQILERAKAHQQYKFYKKLTDLFIRINSPMVIGAAAVILFFIFYLSILLPSTEKKELLKKTDDFCMSTAIGISSATIEAISGNKRAMVSDYLINLHNQNISGLKDVRVFELKKTSSLQAVAIGSFHGDDALAPDGRELTGKIAGLKASRKEVVTNAGLICYDYYYPITWKVRLKGEDRRIVIGAIFLRFSEREVLQHYFEFRRTAAWMTAGALVSSILIISFYLVLFRLLKLKIAEIHELSITDALTQIYNRKRFNEGLEDELKRHKRYGGLLSLIMFDIDHFKSVNDTYGHDTGDLVLVTVTSVVKKAVRQTDLLARWGGEEFMILVPHTGLKESADFADRIRQDIEKFTIDQVGHVTCSFGVAAYAEDDSAESFIKKADQALYQSKEGGRNRVTVAG